MKQRFVSFPATHSCGEPSSHRCACWSLFRRRQRVLERAKLAATNASRAADDADRAAAASPHLATAAVQAELDIAIAEAKIERQRPVSGARAHDDSDDGGDDGSDDGSGNGGRADLILAAGSTVFKSIITDEDLDDAADSDCASEERGTLVPGVFSAHFDEAAAARRAAAAAAIAAASSEASVVSAFKSRKGKSPAVSAQTSPPAKDAKELRDTAHHSNGAAPRPPRSGSVVSSDGSVVVAQLRVRAHRSAGDEPDSAVHASTRGFLKNLRGQASAAASPKAPLV